MKRKVPKVIVEEAKKGRGRPTTFDRDQLVEIVMNEFWDHGYKEVSMNQIAQRSGLTRTSLYNCFETKEALFLAALERYFLSAPDLLLDNLKEGESVADAFYGVFDKACHDRAKDKKNRGCMAINCISEMIASNTPLGDHLLGLLEYRKALIRTLMVRAVAQKELAKDVDVDFLSDLMVTFMCGFSTFSKTGASKAKMITLCYGFLRQIGFSRTESK